jgi:hypothetical protein
MSRVRLFLHIGQHKTGSKALQSFLAYHANALKDRGILYPIQNPSAQGVWAYTISQYRFFALLRKEAMEVCGELPESVRLWREQQKAYSQPFDSIRSLLESYTKQASGDRARTLVISAEDLFDMHSAHELDFSMDRVEAGTGILSRIFKELAFDPTIVVYLRRQDHLLGAHYVQYIKGSDRNDLDFESFAKAFAARLRLCDILSYWASAFGANRIRVRRYESSALPAGIVPDFFSQILGFSVPANWVAPPRDPESVNLTPSRDFVEFIRILNRRQLRGLPVFRREDVLKAALTEEIPQNHGSGVGAWLSPESRRSMLEVHAEGNTNIANRYLTGSAPTLFMEPVPEVNAEWREYSGLSPERATEIALKIHGLIKSTAA